jgi:hypothetical protein
MNKKDILFFNKKLKCTFHKSTPTTHQIKWSVPKVTVSTPTHQENRHVKFQSFDFNMSSTSSTSLPQSDIDHNIQPATTYHVFSDDDDLPGFLPVVGVVYHCLDARIASTNVVVDDKILILFLSTWYWGLWCWSVSDNVYDYIRV